MSTTGNLVNFYVIWIQRKKINKIELSHTSQVENPDHVTHFLHCNKGNKMRPYGGQNGDVWLSFSLHPTDMKSTCQLLSKAPLPFSFWCLFSCFWVFHLNFSGHLQSVLSFGSHQRAPRTGSLWTAPRYQVRAPSPKQNYQLGSTAKLQIPLP